LDSVSNDFPLVVVGHLKLFAIAIQRHLAELGRISPLPSLPSLPSLSAGATGSALLARRLGAGGKDEMGATGKERRRDQSGGRRFD
jgi:hypothetical protein